MIREVFTDESDSFLDSQIALRIEPAGLKGWAGRPTLMGAAHQHDDLELNLVAEGGTMLYLFGGTPVEVGPGRIAVFWAAVPHQLVANTATEVHWVHVPFKTFLSWRLPDGMVSLLLSGRPQVCAALPSDPANFAQWASDLADPQPDRHRIAMLEVEARIRRLALVTQDEPVRPYAGGDGALRQVVAMVRHIAAHFREPLTVAEIAAATRLHPNYAMTQFRRVMHATMGDYLTRCRLAEARRLLVTTELPIGQVAAAAGFGSVSRFYTTFTSTCGMPPAAFRRDHRHRTGTGAAAPSAAR